MLLRPYQQQVIDDAREQFRLGASSALIVSPTGSGKTVLIAFMLKRSADLGRRSLFIVHRKELIEQSSRTFSEVGLDHGIIAAGCRYEPGHSVYIASIQTLARRVGQLDFDPEFVVVDECHHIAAKSWSSTRESLACKYFVGLTAHPARLDGRGLGDWFETVVSGPSVAELIEEGYLCDYRLFAPPPPDMAGVKTRCGDWVRSQLEAVVDKPKITGEVIDQYRQRCMGARAICFCPTVKHSKHVADQFRMANIPAAHVDGDTSSMERESIVNLFRRGDIKVLTNVELFGEGFDVPGIEAVILLRPTKSHCLFRQQIGRALRPAEGKARALILDHVGNSHRHGLPDDDIEWSLDGVQRGPGQEVHIRICQMCFAAQKPGRDKCIWCGTTFEKKVVNRVPEQVDGDLIEMKKHERKVMLASMRARAKTVDELADVGRAAGYKYPRRWAKHVINGRKRRKAIAGI